MTENELSKLVIGCAMKVHSTLGPGLLESAYEECLFYELAKQGVQVERQKPMPLIYESVRMECGYRVDLMVGGKLIIEVKSVEALNEVHLAQVLTYLKISGCTLGLLLNFKVAHMRDGIKRVIN
jgi:GxxExxY protein